MAQPFTDDLDRYAGESGGKRVGLYVLNCCGLIRGNGCVVVLRHEEGVYVQARFTPTPSEVSGLW